MIIFTYTDFITLKDYVYIGGRYMKSKTKVLLTFDVDFQFVWVGSYKKTTLRELSRGEFGARVGIFRVLEMLDDHELKATFFVPGKIAEIYPSIILEIQDRGHEIGLHGYIHERWNELDEDEERTTIRKGKKAIESLTGEKIDGFRSPAFDLNFKSPRILLDEGIKYDSSLSAQDYYPYYLRSGDYFDLSGNVTFGKETELLEIPVPWELDDFPYFAHGRHRGLANPDTVKSRWLEELNYAQKLPDSVVTYVMHPQIIGRGPRIEMLSNLISEIRDEIEFCTMKDIYLNFV